MKYSDIENEEERRDLLEFCTQGRRKKEEFRLWKNKGYYTIYGHTPKPGKIVEDDECGCVRIDAGCGQNDEKASLALYCVDDKTVKYFSEGRTENSPGDGR